MIMTKKRDKIINPRVHEHVLETYNDGTICDVILNDSARAYIGITIEEEEDTTR